MDLTHLRALLERHDPADAVEAAHRSRMLGLLSADAPCARDHYAPGHFTASAFVLSPERDALLLIFHGKLHRWLQPGGHIDPEDPDVIQAALREVAEETGLTDVELLEPERPVLDLDVHEIPPLKGNPSHEHFDVRIVLRALTREVQAGSDAAGARWVALEQMHEVESDASVMRAVKTLTGRLEAQ